MKKIEYINVNELDIDKVKNLDSPRFIVASNRAFTPEELEEYLKDYVPIDYTKDISELKE